MGWQTEPRRRHIKFRGCELPVSLHNLTCFRPRKNWNNNPLHHALLSRYQRSRSYMCEDRPLLFHVSDAPRRDCQHGRSIGRTCGPRAHQTTPAFKIMSSRRIAACARWFSWTADLLRSTTEASGGTQSIGSQQTTRGGPTFTCSSSVLTLVIMGWRCTRLAARPPQSTTYHARSKRSTNGTPATP